MDSEMTAAVREIRQKVDEAKSSLSSNRSRGRVLDALMQQKKRGKIAGIYGRLVTSPLIQPSSPSFSLFFYFILFL